MHLSFYSYSQAMIFETSQHAAAKTPRPKRHEGKPDDTLRKKDEDDSHSVADTDFNEPWDSNAWENLLDLARFGDGKVYAPKSDNTICPSITAVFSPSRLRNVAQEHPGEEDPAKLIQQYIIAISTDDQTVFGATISRFVECTMLSKQQDPYVMIRRVRQFLDGMKNYLVKNGEAELHLIIERESDRLHADEFLNIDAILESVLNKILLVRVKAQLYRLMILETTRNGELGKLTENLAHVRAMDAVGLGFPEGMQMPDSTQMELISKQLRKMQNHYSPLRKFQLLLRVLSMVVPQARLSSSSGSGSDQSQSHPTRRAAPHPQSPHSRHHHHHPQQQQTRQSASSNGSSGGLLLAASATLSSSRHRIESSDTGTGSSNSCVTAALKNPPADELIRWLVYLLARCSTINCEIEAWYMWELLPQQVLSTGDAVYFLSIFFSAVHVLKHPDTIRRLKNVELATSAGSGGNLHSLADFMGSKSTLHDSDDHSDLLLRVAIPNEQEGTIEYHTFPVLPKMNAAKLCRVIAHQFSISNPEDYGLFVLFNGHETCLGQAEFPHLIRDKLRETGKPHLFAYKRAEACIAWPRQAVSHCSTTTALSPSPAQQMMLNKEGAGRQLRIG